ncbi:hypothetical protein P171DRAFT_523976 [Karstenula rhodostoma CBS 690.94]|uniref:PSP1 C-terminal domain-containing protein n=1 Tax=Karstenula rhodostoma CBS 690.94 TaxID=1392251 RepID=A0A9P4U890_9PLEO|nr:hypothetical protein P171DRAFT_523976 [Karstenula rhodostoma CBS 690.94]
MEILDAKFQWDHHKISFFYNVKSYVDFKILVGDLFKHYKICIWMSAVNPASVVNLAGMQIKPSSAIFPGCYPSVLGQVVQKLALCLDRFSALDQLVRLHVTHPTDHPNTPSSSRAPMGGKEGAIKKSKAKYLRVYIYYNAAGESSESPYVKLSSLTTQQATNLRGQYDDAVAAGIPPPVKKLKLTDTYKISSASPKAPVRNVRTPILYPLRDQNWLRAI